MHETIWKVWGAPACPEFKIDLVSCLQTSHCTWQTEVLQGTSLYLHCTACGVTLQVQTAAAHSHSCPYLSDCLGKTELQGLHTDTNNLDIRSTGSWSATCQSLNKPVERPQHLHMSFSKVIVLLSSVLFHGAALRKLVKKILSGHDCSMKAAHCAPNTTLLTLKILIQTSSGLRHISPHGNKVI